MFLILLYLDLHLNLYHLNLYFRRDRYRLHLGHAAPVKVFEVLSDTFKDLAALSYLSSASWETIQATDLTGYSFMGEFILLDNVLLFVLEFLLSPVSQNYCNYFLKVWKLPVFRQQLTSNQCALYNATGTICIKSF